MFGPDVLEAATSMGCTRRQILFQIQLPMALPEIMLGLNQTIMYGLAMLVIAAFSRHPAIWDSWSTSRSARPTPAKAWWPVCRSR